MRSLLLLSSLLLSCLSFAGRVHLQLSAPGHANEPVVLYTYADLITLRLAPINDPRTGSAVARTDAEGTVVLEAEIEGTTKAMMRVGEMSADLWLREGSYRAELPPPAPNAVRSINGTMRVDLIFRELDHMDINALLADLNTRLDAFIAEDLATDQAGGMRAIDHARERNEPLHTDSAQRPKSLFVSPTWSAARVDTFEMKLRRFYAEVKDPWFWNDLEYGVAGLRFGPRTNDRALFERYLKGKPVLYDVPEYVRFVSSFFEDHMKRNVFRSDEAALVHHVKNAALDSLFLLFAKNDFLKDDARLRELIVMKELYANYHDRTFDREGIRTMLAALRDRSEYAEHRSIAANMLWDLTEMRAGSELPVIGLHTLNGEPAQLNEELSGATLIVVTAGWCTYCEQEMVALQQLNKEYGSQVHIIAIGMDASPEELKAYVKAHPDREWSWYYGGDDPLLLDRLRVRTLPAFFLLNDRTIARSPAPPPSNGLAALLYQIKARWEEEHKFKPDGGHAPPKRR